MVVVTLNTLLEYCPHMTPRCHTTSINFVPPPQYPISEHLYYLLSPAKAIKVLNSDVLLPSLGDGHCHSSWSCNTSRNCVCKSPTSALSPHTDSYSLCHAAYFSFILPADGLQRSTAFNTSVVVIVSNLMCRSPIREFKV